MEQNYTMSDTQIDCYVIAEIAYLMSISDDEKYREMQRKRINYFLDAIQRREDKS